MFYVGTKPENMTAELLDQLVEEFDDIVIANNGYKYMHSRTTKDPTKRAKLDPNLRHAERRRLAAASESNGSGQSAASREPAV
jgi:hypothetical protein